MKVNILVHLLFYRYTRLNITSLVPYSDEYWTGLDINLHPVFYSLYSRPAQLLISLLLKQRVGGAKGESSLGMVTSRSPPLVRTPFG